MISVSLLACSWSRWHFNSQQLFALHPSCSITINPPASLFAHAPSLSFTPLPLSLCLSMSCVLGGWATQNHIALTSSTKTHNKLGHCTAASPLPPSLLLPPVRVPKKRTRVRNTPDLYIWQTRKHTHARWEGESDYLWHIRCHFMV